MTNPDGVKFKDVNGYPLIVTKVDECKEGINCPACTYLEGINEAITEIGEKILRLNREKTAKELFEMDQRELLGDVKISWERIFEADPFNEIRVEFLLKADALNLKLKEMLEAE